MYKIRSGALSDYPALRDYDVFIGDRRLDLQAGALTVADTASQQAVGYICISSTAFLGWPLLSILCVRADHRRCGVGTALLRNAIEDHRFTRLYTSTEVGNAAMRALLQRLDAQEIGYADQLNMDGAREMLFRLR